MAVEDYVNFVLQKYTADHKTDLFSGGKFRRGVVCIVWLGWALMPYSLRRKGKNLFLCLWSDVYWLGYVCVCPTYYFIIPGQPFTFLSFELFLVLLHILTKNEPIHNYTKCIYKFLCLIRALILDECNYLQSTEIINLCVFYFRMHF